MAGRLLERQVSLLEHLTSGDAIFGDSAVSSRERARLGIDAGLLRLEARASHEKRMEKIEWVLPRTLELLGAGKAAIIRDFVQACPPASIGRLENARQFHDFLATRWKFGALEPRCLPDVAACELAYASIYGGEKPGPEMENPAAVDGIRRHPKVILVRCRHDVRPILERGATASPIAERDTPLAVSLPTGAEHPVMSELSPDLFDLLEMLDDFVEMKTFSSLPDVCELIADLGRRGFLEVRP